MDKETILIKEKLSSLKKIALNKKIAIITYKKLGEKPRRKKCEIYKIDKVPSILGPDYYVWIVEIMRNSRSRTKCLLLSRILDIEETSTYFKPAYPIEVEI
jgi:hypothetical protein